MGDLESDEEIMEPKNKKFNGPRKSWKGERVILYHKENGKSDTLAPFYVTPSQPYTTSLNLKPRRSLKRIDLVSIGQLVRIAS